VSHQNYFICSTLNFFGFSVVFCAMTPDRLIHDFFPWHTVSSMICLFESSTCFEQLCAHPQEDNCVNTTSDIITLKISEWSKITKITRIYRGCMQPRYILVILVMLGHSLIFRVIMSEVVLIQLSSWGWAHSCSKHVEDSNKHIIEETVCQGKKSCISLSGVIAQKTTLKPKKFNVEQIK